MCGIVGFVNVDAHVDLSRKKWFYQALLVDQLRGTDSTGIAILNKLGWVADEKPEVQVFKKAMSSGDFLQLSTTKDLIKDVDDCKVALGHNRSATTGSGSNPDYAHPFTCGDVTLVHNGTLISNNGLDNKHIVDSHNIAEKLGSVTSDKYIDIIQDLHGAFALVWINSAENKVYFTRNSERTLWLGKGSGGKTLYFASEDWMIWKLTERIDSKMLDIAKEDLYDVELMPTEQLFSVDYNKDSIQMESAPWKEFEYPIQKKGFGMGYGGGTNGYGGGYSPYYNTPTTNLVPFAGACPAKVGELVSTNDWNFIASVRKGKKTVKGYIKGLSDRWSTVTLVAPNISDVEGFRLEAEAKDWLDDEQELDVVLMGEVTQVSKLKNKAQWVVSLSPKSLKVQAYEIDVPTTTTTGFKIGDKEVTSGEWFTATAVGCDGCGCDILLAERDSVTWRSTIIMDRQTGLQTELLDPVCGACSILSDIPY